MSIDREQWIRILNSEVGQFYIIIRLMAWPRSDIIVVVEATETIRSGCSGNLSH